MLCHDPEGPNRMKKIIKIKHLVAGKVQTPGSEVCVALNLKFGGSLQFIVILIINSQPIWVSRRPMLMFREGGR